MTTIGLISDTHGYLDENIFKHFAQCDEIWHAGDFGSEDVIEKLSDFKPLRGVYGNIDGAKIRQTYPEQEVFTCEDVVILMQHIAGYPGKYGKGIKEDIKKTKAGLFISGHSHILKIMFDKDLQCLHMNPGAAGKQGWHKVRTLIRFSIDAKDIKNCDVIELQPR